MTNANSHPEPPCVTDVEPRQLKQWLDEGKAVLIDVRERDERIAERIDGAESMPLSRFDPSTLPDVGDRIVVLHCRSGTRSNEAAQRAIAAGHSEIRQLKGGLSAWAAAGLPVTRAANAPIPIMRQVQIAAGSLVFIGTVLGVLVSPWFLILSGFVGAGLAFAGLTGTCGMATLLSRMPWNRAFKATGSCASK